MKEFSQLITITELSSTKQLVLLVDPYTIEPVQETGNNGSIYSIDLNLYSSDQIPSYYQGREFSASISINDGDIKFGNKDYPAKISITKHLNLYAVKISCKQPFQII